MVDHLLFFLLGALVAAFLIKILRVPARHLGLVDIPGGRKLHGGDVPLVGGIGLFGGFAFVALGLDQALGSYRGLFLGGGILLIAGVLDDLREIRPLTKASAQVLAAAFLVGWGGLGVSHLGHWPGLGILDLGWFAVPFTFLCVVGLVNAVNMLDGADGLAGGVYVVMLGWLLIVAWIGGEPQHTKLPVTLLGSVFGFLLFNFPHPLRGSASIFLGDAGSLFLGFSLAWFALDVTFTGSAMVPPVTTAWILGLPVFDTISIMVRRLIKGQNPMEPDREHLHHIFQRAGFSLRGTVYLVTVLALGMGAVGVTGWLLGIPDWVMLVAWLLAFVGHIYFVQHAWRMVRAIRWLRKRRSNAWS